MKPERLQVEGFAPFRTRVDLDFSGLELFALTGPTGSGKSSVIDAMTFALYGSVARYDRKSVEPVISLGMAVAKTRFEFMVGDDHYTVARVVRRTPNGGASTAEARLLRGEEVVASGAANVTASVESLLGLGLSHFTRSVVLPQGEFAAFLHDTPSGQQDLVKALLDIGIIDQIRRRASERARRSQDLADAAGARIEPLADATDQRLASAQAHFERLRAMTDDVAAHEESIRVAEAAQSTAQATLAGLSGKLDRLDDVSLPDDLGRISHDLSAVSKRIDDAKEAMEAARLQVERTRDEADELPSTEVLGQARRWYADYDSVRARVDSMDLDAVEKAVEDLRKQVSSDREGLGRAEERVAQANLRHAAHALVTDHRAGDPCPVCSRPLEADPDPPPEDLEAASSALAAAKERAEDSNRRLAELERAQVEARAHHEAASAQLARLADQESSFPPRSSLDGLEQRRKALDGALTEARKGLAAAQDSLVAAEQERAGLDAVEKTLWDRYATVRDGLGDMDPPPSDREDLNRAWTGLVDWAGKRRSEVHAEVIELRASLADGADALDKQRAELAQILEEAGVEGEGAASSRLAAAIATARAQVARTEERRSERLGLEADRNRFSEAAKVATSLDNHLKANHFQSWLLAEALETLLMGANRLLAQLTDDAYSLALDARSIEVVDHRNADERRSVRSLSGGETFLVSLALALSLGEQIVDVSQKAGAKLEAIFLDEGFGSLDPEALETVTAVVTELASTGRVVGVVTHVKELAEQIPVRFEVRPGAAGSTIHRVQEMGAS